MRFDNPSCVRSRASESLSCIRCKRIGITVFRLRITTLDNEKMYWSTKSKYKRTREANSIIVRCCADRLSGRPVSFQFTTPQLQRSTASRTLIECGQTFARYLSHQPVQTALVTLHGYVCAYLQSYNAGTISRIYNSAVQQVARYQHGTDNLFCGLVVGHDEPHAEQHNFNRHIADLPANFSIARDRLRARLPCRFRCGVLHGWRIETTPCTFFDSVVNFALAVDKPTA